MSLNMKKISKYIFFISISLIYTNLTLGRTCSQSLRGHRQYSPFLPPLFLVTVDKLMTNAKDSTLPTDLFQVAARNLLPLGILQKDTADFFETYREHSRYLEEYSTDQDRERDPFPITRFHSHYRWLADRMLEISYGTQSSSKTMMEMAKVNQWITENEVQGIPSNKSIRDLDNNIIGTPELRAAVYVQLKLTNQALSPENAIKTFKEIKMANSSSTVSGDLWPKLNSIVERTKGRVDYLQALKALEVIEHFQKQVATSEFNDQGLVLLALDRLGLPVDTESLSTIENAYHRASQMTEKLPNKTLTPDLFLRYFAIVPDAMKLVSLVEVLDFINSESPQFIDASFKHEKLSSTSAIALLYLSRLVPNETNFKQLSLLHRCINDYNTIFKKPKTVGWKYEELFADTLIP